MSITFSLMLFVLLISGCSTHSSEQFSHPVAQNSGKLHCGSAWVKEVDTVLNSGDGQGHGPDLGSTEWQSVIEFKLGIRNNKDKPALNSTAWCGYIDKHLSRKVGNSPSFSCDDVKIGSMESIICGSNELSSLDKELDAIYRQIIAEPHPKLFKAQQRGWIKGRNECWKSSDKLKCLKQSYIQRIAELQARFALVKSPMQVQYQCGNQVLNIAYYDTQPQTLVADFNNSEKIMFIEKAETPSYRSGDYQLRLKKHDNAELIWGYGSKPLTCSFK
ncbi:lysozyme inhibitor LprI family protein [Pseudoalteromonas piscicida]|uniref:lysozyme inhibitor LprI family protein n=1 Tax=Pseudoalteromonas piscicida TaxID=43662 RepID=UPI00309B23B6